MGRSIRLLTIAGIITLTATAANAQGWGQRLDDAVNQRTNNKKDNNNNNQNNHNNQQGRNNNNGNNGNSNGSGNNGRGGGLNLGQGLGQNEIVNGLKEALSIGAKNAGAKLNITNGFFGNNVIKILMPPEAAKVENALRRVGMGKTVDDAILSMNRAAEDAAGKAAPIFIDAVTSMNISDGLNILRGGNGAATAYLKQKTTAALTEAFRPVIENALNKSGATTLWNNVFSTYNKLPMTREKINPDLVAYATERALSGLFITISDEENKIRNNAGSRVTSLLQKVFGG